jgi:hypothetical protein
MHCLSTGGGAAGTGGVYIMVDVSDHNGKILFTQNVIISNDVKFDRVLWGRLHVM